MTLIIFFFDLFRLIRNKYNLFFYFVFPFFFHVYLSTVTDKDSKANEERDETQDGIQVHDMLEILSKTESTDAAHQGAYRRKTLQGDISREKKLESVTIGFFLTIVFVYFFAQCVICNRAFTQKSSLQIHMWQHNGIRPHSCNLCTAKFSQKGSDIR